MNVIEPFAISVDEQVITDLCRRIRHTRWPDQLLDVGWEQGTELTYLRALLDYWSEEFDWSSQEQELNRFNHCHAEVDGLSIHFVHERGKSANAIPLLLTHGWPSTFLEWLPLVPLLTDPEAHGIDGPAFDLVIPSLPGFGFSDRPRQRGASVAYTAELWDRLMRDLGYQRYGAGGGDFGSAVTTFLGLQHPESLLGLYLTTLDVSPYTGVGSPALSPAESAYLEGLDAWWSEEGGYKGVQASKPQTLSYGLTDSPAGLAAWLIEKWRSWGDTGGDVDARFGRDFLLATLTIYWATETIASSSRYYYDDRGFGTVCRDDVVGVPTAVAVFANQYVPEGTPPREWAERLYNLRRWTLMPRGGHFAACEEPRLVGADIASFFRGLTD